MSIAGDRSKQEGKRRRKKRKVARHLNRLLLGRRNAKETCQLRYLSRHCVVTTTWLRVTKWNCTGMIIFYRGVTCPKHCVTTLENLAAENGNIGGYFLLEVYIFLFYTSQNPDCLICGQTVKFLSVGLDPLFLFLFLSVLFCLLYTGLGNVV